LKNTFLSMRSSKVAGRVRLAEFYKMGLHSHWQFTEKKEYLRSLGALDESNASSPMVIIPNYVGTRSNCLEATNLYAVCCRNECEDLMGHLELKIAASAASPHHIVELVRQLSSDTVRAPRMLPQSMISRLHSIASQSDGKVRLHGRLFAQWMHHAFPNECPFPHEAGTASPLTPDEWIGTDVSASKEERQKVVDEDSCTAEGQDASKKDLPWSDEEELLAPPPRRSETRPAPHQLGLYAALAAVVLTVFALLSDHVAPLRQTMKASAAKRGLSWQLLLVGWFSSIALAVNLVDRGLFAFVICGGLVSNYLARGPHSTKAMKCDKSFV